MTINKKIIDLFARKFNTTGDGGGVVVNDKETKFVT